MLYETVKALGHLLHNLNLTGWLTVGRTIPSLDSLPDSSLSDYFSSFSRVGLLTVSVSFDLLEYQNCLIWWIYNLNLQGNQNLICKKFEIFSSISSRNNKIIWNFHLQILRQANSLIANNNIRNVILEIKTTAVKSLKY